MVKRLGFAYLGLQAVDGFMTWWATNNGFHEVNPLMAPMASTWLLPVYKVGVTAIGMFFLFRWARRRSVAVGVALGVGVVGMLVVVGLNLKTLAAVLW